MIAGANPLQEATPCINGDMGRRVVIDTTSMAWERSPSPRVWRKRLHLVGARESGQVTSIVRYEAGASFAVHHHPEGEEILVLEGTFSDEHGDWPAGTYLLNPEGFRHAPFSRDGCVIFVKLRQYAGIGRRRVVVNINDLPWLATADAAIDKLDLYTDAAFADHTCVQRWAPGAAPGSQHYRQGVEMLVLEGTFSDECGRYSKGCWLRLPVGAHHRPQSANGCLLYMKTGALSSLRSVTAKGDEVATMLGDRQ